MKCKECGNEYVISSAPHTHRYEDYCFDCAFWLSKIDDIDNIDQVIIDGYCYRVGDSDRIGGLGGEFKIIRFDGLEIVTSNLWCNGKVDGRFRERLKDNAVFAPIKKANNIPVNSPF